MEEVSLLGHAGEIRWGQDAWDQATLRVVLPGQKPYAHAWSLKVRFRE